MKKQFLFLTMLITILILGLVACGTTEDEASEPEDEAGQTDENADQGDLEDRETLIMATSADFPPFETRNTEGDIVGFDIDLAEYIAAELGYDLEIRDMNFDGLIGALQSNRVDFVLSGMSATEGRRENVDFSTEYHYSSEMFVTLKDSAINAIEDLEGTTVGVQLGTIQQEGAALLQEDYDFDVKAVDDATMLIQELLSNRIDIAYLDRSAALGFIAAQDLAGFEDPTTSSPGMAVAFPKGSELINDVNAAIEKAEESGHLQELKDQWLSEED